VSQAADLVLFVGTNFPFARYLPQGIKFIQVNNNLADLGKQHDADITVLADAKEFFQALLQSEVTIKPTKFLKAAQRDKQNWNRWLKTIATDDQGG
ncbi:hypothetical protein NL524_29720, partial [Klebsiella pneumoniae]|nr:hypothetical protein [Klebsiella pneumoniae]